VPDGTNNIWVDSTFTDSDPDTEDVAVEYFPAAAENIGTYSMPVIYTAEEVENETEDITLTYQTSTAVSGTESISSYYFLDLSSSGTITTPTEFYGVDYPTVSGTINTTHAYLTGHTAISGSVNEKVTFVCGNQYDIADSVALVFWSRPSSSGTEDFLTNYTNYTGSESGGSPVPSYDGTVDNTHEYGNLYLLVSGTTDKIVDITFAGYVWFPFTADVYSTLLSIGNETDFEVTTISGNVEPIWSDIYSTALTVSGIDTDVYCSLLSISDIDCETTVISGSVTPINGDVYSTAVSGIGVSFDVDLYSLKISNFSLGIGEYTTASGYISVDVTDDECPVSTSGTYFMVDGVQVSGTLSSITDGYRMTYDPADDFSSLDGSTTFTVHAENTCGDYLEDDFYLTFGYRVEFDNSSGDLNNIDYGFNNKVAVRVTAEDMASCPELSSLAWVFDSKEQFNTDLSASIVGVTGSVTDQGDLSAEIYPQSNAYFYGKSFTVVVNAKDFAGNQMEPFVLTYTIEDEPE
jgi:hypothetical protein